MIKTGRVCSLRYLFSVIAILLGLVTTAPVNGKPEESPSLQAHSTEFIKTLTGEERAWLKNHPVVSVFQDPGWPPVEFMDKQGNPSGMTAEYLTLIAQRLGIQFKRIRNITWLEGFDRLKRWEIDMTTSVAVTPQRSEFWAFTQPYMNIPIVIATQMDVTYIADLHELSGKRVAVVENYAIDDWLAKDFPDIPRARVKTALAGLEMLQRGEVFAYIDNLLIIGDYQAKMKITNIKIAGQTPYVNAQCMAVRKDWAPLAGILQKALDSVSELERNDIYRRWLPIRYEQGYDYRLFWKALAVFFGILLAMAVWNWKMAKEIKSRKHAEAALRESEGKYRLLAENISDVIWILDIDTFRFRYVSPSVENLRGYTVEEVMSEDAVASLTPASAQYLAQVLPSRLAEYEQGILKSYTDEIEQPRKNGNTVWTETTTRYILNSETGRIEVYGVSRDISERKKSEAEKLKLEERLRQAQKLESIGTLAGGIAHDFNNILSPLLGFAELLKEDIPKDSPLQDYTKEIIQAALRSKDLVTQILAFGRKGEPSTKSVLLQPLIKEAMKLMRSSIPSTIDIRYDIDPDCGTIMADPTQIHQIVVNLATNAFHAMEDTGGELTVGLKTVVLGPVSDPALLQTLSPGGYALLTISDTGRGIEKNVLDKIFDPYFTTKRVGKGTGLGLSVVEGIVKVHKGAILIDSAHEKGTTVRVYLPMMDEIEIDSASAESHPDRGGNERILFVDDEEAIVYMAQQTLGRLGYRVQPFTDSLEAIHAFKTAPEAFDLIITDMTMPNVTGDKLTEEILSIKPDIPIILCTGFNDKIDEKSAKAIGIKGFLLKPIVRSVLAEMVRTVLNDAARTVLGEVSLSRD